MSSVSAAFSQPLTKNFAVTQGSGGAYYFTQSDIDTWYAANASKINKIGSVYVIPGTSSGSTFYDVLFGENGATRLGQPQNDSFKFYERKTLTDLGKTIHIGNAADSSLLVLRLVRGYGPAAAGGDGNTIGYVVVQNDDEDLGGDVGRFTIRVARV
jgi:hypothetical protein